MPIHDWTKANSGTFHAFHVAWIAEIQRSLNGGVLPEGYYALAEQAAGSIIPDVLALHEPGDSDEGAPNAFAGGGGTAVAEARPRTFLTDTISETRSITPPQRQISIRHTIGDRIVALLEIVSPRNKEKRSAVEQFIDKATLAIGEGLHLLVVDLFPPGTFDADGLHGLLWSRLGGRHYDPPADQPLTLAACDATGVTCYVEPTSVGKCLIDMPLFLASQRYVNVSLEQTYSSAYQGMPKRWRQVIEGAGGQ